MRESYRISRVATDVRRSAVRTLLVPATSRLLSDALTVVLAVRSTVLAAATSRRARDCCSILGAYWQPRTFWRMDSEQTPTGPEHHGPRVDTQQTRSVQPQGQTLETELQDSQSRSQSHSVVSVHKKYQNDIGGGWGGSKYSQPASQY